jgi:hypothetical protein
MYILMRKYKSLNLDFSDYWTGRTWDDSQSKAKEYKSEAIAANAAKRIMSAGRHNEQNITVKEVK